MKKSLSFVLFIVISALAYAQDIQLCDEWYTDAESAYKNNNFKLALNFYNLIVEECSDSYADCKAKIAACNEAIAAATKPVPSPSPKPGEGKVQPPKPGKEKPNKFLVDKKRVTFPERGGSNQIHITADCSWSVRNNPNWVMLAKDGNVLTVSCDVNFNSSAREGDIVLVDANSKELRVTAFQDRNRDYVRPSFTLIEDENGKGGTYPIKVSSNKPWSVVSYPYWCRVETSGDEIKVTLERNYNGYERQGEVVLALQSNDRCRSTISVKQFVLGNYLNLSFASFHNSSGRGSLSQPITVETDLGSFSVENVPSWCRIEQLTSSSFVVRILPNNGGGARSAEMKVVAGGKSLPFKVSQAARPYYVNVDNTVTLVKKTGGYQIYYVETNCGPWQVVNLPYWCQLEDETNDSFKVTFLPNDDASPRQATFTVSASGDRCDITVKQK